jgi:hypothetical protein
VGIRDVTGVFSRYFIVGFFIPTLFTLLVLERLLSSQTVPDALEAYREDTRILVLGASALLIGLVLVGLQGFLLDSLFTLGPLGRALRRRQMARFDRFWTVREDKERHPAARAQAAFEIERGFGSPFRDRVLPTRLANVARAYERSGYHRWRLDVSALWPRVEMLLTKEQRELDIDAKTDVAFFINGSLGCLIIAIAKSVDWAANQTDARATAVTVGVSVLLARLLYLAAVGAASRWSARRGAALDLHRNQLFASLGFREPTSYEDGLAVGAALSRFVTYGIQPPEDVLAKPHRSARPPKQATSPVTDKPGMKP